MYATNRLLGFESVSSTFFGTRAESVPVKPTPDVQKLLDAAANLPKVEQLAGYEKALNAAIVSKDPAGARFSIREIRNLLIATKRTNEIESYLLGLQKRAQQAMFPLMEAHVHVYLALTYRAEQKIDKVIVEYESAANLFEVGGDKAEQSRALTGQAVGLRVLGKHEVAANVLALALRLAKESGDQRQLASILHHSAANLRYLSRFDLALVQLNESLELFKILNDKSSQSDVLNDIANIHSSRGNQDTAISLHEESLAIRRSLDDRSAIALSLFNIAVIHRKRGDIDKALTLHNESLAIERELGDKASIATSLGISASIHSERGDVEQALALHIESLALNRELGDKAGIAASLGRIANIHSSRGDTAKALAMHTESLAIKRELGDKSGIAVTLGRIANIHSSNGDLDKALSLHDESLSIRRSIADKSGIAISLNNIAVILTKRGDTDKALTLYDESLAIARELGDKANIAASLGLIANIHSSNGDLDKALALYIESLAIVRELGNKSVIAASLGLIATIHESRGNLETALSMHFESLTMFRVLMDKSGIATSLRGIGVNHFIRGDLDKAMMSFTESLSICRDLGDKSGTAYCLQNIASLYWGSNTSLTMYSEALSIFRDIGNIRGIVICLINTAGVYEVRGAFNDSLAALLESESICRDRNLHILLAANRKVYANLQETLGRAELASGSREEAILLYDQVGDVEGKWEVLVGHGKSLLDLGKPISALSAFSKARDLRLQAGLNIESINYCIGEAQIACGEIAEGMSLLAPSLDFARREGRGDCRALTALGRAHLREGKPALAEQPLRYALAFSLRNRSPDDTAKVYSALADHALAMKDRDVAIIHLKRAIEARQVQRRGSIGLDDVMIASLSLKVAPDYRKLAGLLTDAGRLGEAMEVAELLKRSEAKVRGGDVASETPTDQGKVSAAEVAYRKAAEVLGKLGDRERFLSKVKYPSDNVKAEIAAMPAKLKVANKALTDALNRVVAEEKAAGSAAGRMRDTGAAQARLAATLKRLGPGYAAVTVLCLPDSIRFLISTPKSLTMKRVTVTEKSLTGQVKALRDALLDPTSDPLPSAKALHTVLWSPIESELKRLSVKHVLLSLTGTARYVPFGALHNGTQYVAQGWGLSLYSPTVLDHIGDRTIKQWSVLAAGNSKERTVDDGIGSKLRFTSLPGVRAELSRVRQSVGAGPSPILDNDFTLTSLKDGLAKQPNVVHLASHFQFDPRAESLSFLLTGQGEVLRASDTTVLTKDAFKGVDLLTLSACQTGKFSETADGMEVEGIAALMQRKGAGAVMSTLWPVADASTAAFMGTFYTLRAQDPRRTKAWCLRETQLRMILGEVAPPGAPKPGKTRSVTPVKVVSRGLRKDWSHPYHWAPFILQGNPL
jgi:CHAT domain-containing protein